MPAKRFSRRPRTARVFQAQGTKVSFESNISEGLEAMIKAGQGDPIIKACHAGAEIMYDSMRAAAPVNTGLLRDSIYRWRDRKNQRPDKVSYEIGPNKRIAPHWHLVEYGHDLVNVVFYDEGGNLIPTKRRRAAPKHIAARPYIRPTYYNNIDRALEAMRVKLQQEIEKEMAVYA